MTKRELAENYFLQGYNCTQSVVLAYKDEVNIDTETLLKIASGFGGGISRLRETCGCVSGMVIVVDLLDGYSSNDTGEIKNQHYQRIQSVCKKFEDKYGSLSCRTLLGITQLHQDYKATERTKEFYLKRPCKEMIGTASEILEEYIKEGK